MTDLQLQEAKIAEAFIKYHAKESDKLNKSIDIIKKQINKGQIKPEAAYYIPHDVAAVVVDMEEQDREEVIAFSTYRIGNRNYDMGLVNIRPAALVTYLETEAQYHFQKAEEYRRKLARI